MPISVRALSLPPKLWGDGIHDDTAALNWLARQAAIDGRPFVLKDAVHRVSGSLVVDGVPRLEMTGVKLLADWSRHGSMAVTPPILDIRNVGYAHLDGVRLRFVGTSSDPLVQGVDAI